MASDTTIYNALVKVQRLLQEIIDAGGGGGGGGSGNGAILDGVTPTIKATVTGALALKTDGSAVTQPVSGTFWQVTQPVSAAALPLPAGAATGTKQDTGNTSLGNIDTSTQSIANNTNSTKNELITLNAQVATEATLVSVLDGINNVLKSQIIDMSNLLDSDLDTLNAKYLEPVVNESPVSLSNSTKAPLSLTSDGRLRVSVSPAPLYPQYFDDETPFDGDVDFFFKDPWSD